MMDARYAPIALELALNCNTTLIIRLIGALMTNGSLSAEVVQKMLTDAADGVAVPLSCADVDATALKALERYVADLRGFAASIGRLGNQQ
jgi:hypothetical protein